MSDVLGLDSLWPRFMACELGGFSACETSTFASPAASSWQWRQSSDLGLATPSKASTKTSDANLPSGNLLYSYGKSPFIVNIYPLNALNMVIFHSYVKLPEGKSSIVFSTSTVVDVFACEKPWIESRTDPKWENQTPNIVSKLCATDLRWAWLPSQES